jgi:E3 ubiquitin-protein ligase SIAH1
MDDLSRALGEVLLSDLECPVCMQYMGPPIKLCTNGHTICSSCRESVQLCPVCRAAFSEIRCVTLENIVRRLKYPCANRQNGGLEFFSIEHIADHHAVCVYRKIECPFQITESCSWNGLKNDLKEHAKTKHPKFFFDGSNIHIKQSQFKNLSTSVLIVSCFGELFTYCRKIKDDINYAAVRLIGASSKTSKYKCEFTLRAANGIEQISNTFFVRSYSENWETIFDSGKCLCLNANTIKNFAEKNVLKMTVNLSRV